jgi:hypothetical protein
MRLTVPNVDVGDEWVLDAADVNGGLLAADDVAEAT